MANDEEGAIMMNLIDKLNEAKEESFDKWFERWYKKQNLEEQLIIAASQGYSNFRIRIQENYQRSSDFDENRKYLVRRLRDERTVKNIENKLGTGIKVEYKEDKATRKLFGMTINYYSDWIQITWK